MEKSSRGRLVYFPLLLLLPAFIWHMAVVTLPAMSTIIMSLYEWNGIGAGKFVGLANFREIFTSDMTLRRALSNNLLIVAIFVTVPIITGLLVAIAVTRLRRGQMVYRTIYFLPYVLSAAIAGRIWTTLLNPYFGINRALEQLGITWFQDVLWLGDPVFALFTVVFVDNWHFWGFVMVLFIAALHQIDADLYEAARVEGANKVDEFFHITIPGIRPTLVFITMMCIIWSFLKFDYVWVMTMGGPGDATEIISTWIYKSAFLYYRAGYANAICVLQSFICLLIFAVLQFIRKKGWDV